MSSKPEPKQQIEMKFEIKKVKMSDLVPHEGILDWHLKEIFEWMERDGFQLRPIAVSRLDSLGGKWKGKYLIHDGHHRTAALKKLNCNQIMISIFDYNDPRIKVFDYNDVTKVVPKEEVIRRATSGMEVTPRYDKHFIDVGGKLEPFHDNDLLEPERPTPLSQLR
ncbi:MAG: ParB N-terminal domain-containing protein [Nitrososphaerota archaeon]|nr:ParB N-terminal domain-containing protein [Nitrososphaerota archaeon]